MSELSDYRRMVSDPLEAALRKENAELRARLAEAGRVVEPLRALAAVADRQHAADTDNVVIWASAGTTHKLTVRDLRAVRDFLRSLDGPAEPFYEGMANMIIGEARGEHVAVSPDPTSGGPINPALEEGE